MTKDTLRQLIIGFSIGMIFAILVSIPYNVYFDFNPDLNYEKLPTTEENRY